LKLAIISDFAEKLIGQYNWHVKLAHPGCVARMKQTSDKSDWTDAKRVCKNFVGIYHKHQRQYQLPLRSIFKFHQKSPEIFTHPKFSTFSKDGLEKNEKFCIMCVRRLMLFFVPLVSGQKQN